MAIHIRPFSPSDREFVLSLVSRFSEFDLPEWRARAQVDQATSQSLLKAVDQPEPGSVILIAEDEGGTAAGFIHLESQTDYFGEKIGYISEVAISPAFEGQGVGRILMTAAETWALEQDFRLLSLYVFAGNTRARGLYEKLGFGQEVIKYVKAVR